MMREREALRDAVQRVSSAVRIPIFAGENTRKILPEGDPKLVDPKTLKVPEEGRFFEDLDVFLRPVPIDSPSLSRHQSFILAEYHPGGGIGPHYHEEHEETVFVLQGEWVEPVSGRELREGQSLLIPPGQVHGGASPGGCVILVSFSPPLSS